MAELTPYFDDVQAHYDLSDDFFALFLDPTRTYSCAFFEQDDYTLEQAQRAKVDLALGKCDLRPGMRLLEIGCGWGSTLVRAVAGYGVNAVGLTLSQNQFEHVGRLFDDRGWPIERAEVRLQGWEEFSEPVDRIVSIGAFEHFRKERYDAFFEKSFSLLPAGGRMLLHTIVGHNRHDIRAKGLPIDRKLLEFTRFITREIFPGGQLPEPKWVIEGAQRVGFTVERVHPLQLHYARTLDHWSATLSERHDEAVAIASQETFDTYMKYLTGCAELFRQGYVDVMQFTLVKP
jgi:cyclopropane-fatty-acyl-phospholipid synthase